MDAFEVAAKWVASIDEHARQANADLDAASDPTIDLDQHARALVSIASQLAYANVIAAADFYMRHRLDIILRGEES